mmetsp:Transcript_20428/g.26338  ORF Transcript_20428/g.26338 Transcript_20428/m.26338 type:complete len:188 (-) Transcript_20428:294-857(-)
MIHSASALGSIVATCARYTYDVITKSMKLFVLLLCLPWSWAFVPPARQAHQSYGTTLSMAPKFDKSVGKWVVTSEEEGPEAGYGPTKTLLLRGPKPFFSRVVTPDDYEQAVLKFMAGDKCSREVAQGNMDRYLENGQDWAFERLEAEKKGRPYPTYHVLNQKQAVLTIVWSALVFWVGFRILAKYFI